MKWKHYIFIKQNNFENSSPSECTEILFDIEFIKGGNAHTVIIPYCVLESTRMKAYTISYYYNTTDYGYGLINISKEKFRVSLIKDGQQCENPQINVYYR